MAKRGAAFVTGDKEVDALLAQFEPKYQKKYGRKASRDAMKLIKDVYLARAPVDIGAMRDAASIKSAPRSRRYAFGHRLYLDRNKLFALAAKRGKKLSKDKKRNNEPFYYPAVVEFGDKDTPARFPLRKSLFDNESAMRKFFITELARQIRETKPLTK